jgi:two-component system, chemotaxis family, protein-glutamate methylesterase/glutaminase
MTNTHDLIVIGASAGGVEALSRLVRDLPPELPAAVLVVLHVPAHSRSVMPAILTRAGRLPAAHAVDGQVIEAGRVYIAPPDHHMIVKQGIVRLTRGPHENGHRPAVDPLFRTAAHAYGPRVIGVVLSGALDDGSAGLVAIKRRGGLAVVQDPEDALYDGMPRHAIENVAVDRVLPVNLIGAELARLAALPADTTAAEPVTDDLEKEAGFAEIAMDAMTNASHPGTPSGFACPDCGGALWQLQEEEFLRYRCRVGHAWSADSLLAEQTEALEAALWTALRALEEKRELSERLSQRADQRGHQLVATRFHEQAREAEERARLIREVLVSGKALEFTEERRTDEAGHAAPA